MRSQCDDLLVFPKLHLLEREEASCPEMPELEGLLELVIMRNVEGVAAKRDPVDLDSPKRID